jgi:hypothetical protein
VIFSYIISKQNNMSLFKYSEGFALLFCILGPLTYIQEQKNVALQNPDMGLLSCPFHFKNPAAVHGGERKPGGGGGIGKKQ